MKCLVVDDHEDSLRFVERLLMRDGHHVDTAATVCDGKTLLTNGNYDLLITDLSLPDGCGRTLMPIAAARGICGIAISGQDLRHEIQASYSAGFFVHLLKPVSLRQLSSAIEAALVLKGKAH